jgi:hypothetical protein
MVPYYYKATVLRFLIKYVYNAACVIRYSYMHATRNSMPNHYHCHGETIICGTFWLLGYSVQTAQIFFSVLFTDKYRSGVELIIEHDLAD